MDYTAREKRLGKSLGDDFREGKLTLPVIRAIAKATPAERDFWERCMVDGEQEEGSFEEALAILRRHNALAEAMDVARARAEAGKAALKTLPDSPLRREMLDLVDFAVDRDH